MAKQETAAAPVAAPTARVEPMLIPPDPQPAEVVMWGNGAPVSAKMIERASDFDQPDGTEDTTPAEIPSGKTKVATPPAEGDDKAKDPKEGEEATPAAKPKLSPERRQQILDNMKREGKERAIEEQIREARAQAAAAVAKLEEFEKSPLGGKLKRIAAQHGMTLEDLKDKLLVDADDVKDVPATTAPVKEKDPEVAELLKWKADKEKEAGDAQIARAVDGVRDQLKDADLPLVDTFDSYGRVLTKAHAAWKAEGGDDNEDDLMSYIPAAAEIVEEELKKSHPKAAARLYHKAKEETEETPDEEPAPRAAPKPGMGKRMAARPGSKPAALSLDAHERDDQIRKRFGWDR